MQHIFHYKYGNLKLFSIVLTLLELRSHFEEEPRSLHYMISFESFTHLFWGHRNKDELILAHVLLRDITGLLCCNKIRIKGSISLGSSFVFSCFTNLYSFKINYGLLKVKGYESDLMGFATYMYPFFQISSLTPH